MTTNLENKIKKQLELAGVKTLHAYSRKSRDIDEEGLKKHHDIICELGEKLGMPVTFYEEVDSSETMNRVKLNQLRKDIQSKRVRALIIYRMDRLSRKVTDTERLMKEFAFNDLILIEAYREKVVNYKEILGIKLEAMMSDLYQEQVKIVLSEGRKKAVSLYGNHLGTVPLGYNYDKTTKKLIPNSDAWVVKEIFDLYMKGYSIHTIAYKLNGRGLTTQRGMPFGAKAISTIIKNEKYIGTQIYGKYEWYKDAENMRSGKERLKEDWIVYQDAHEPIIEKDYFEKVQRRIDSRNKNKNTVRHTDVLSGLVKCGICGSVMGVITRVYKTQTVCNIRACYKKDVMNGTCCLNGGMNGKIVEDYLVNQIFTVVRPVIMRSTKDMAKLKKSLQTDNRGLELETLTKEERELTKQLDKLIDLQMEHKTERITIKMKQVESQLELVQDRITMVGGEATVDEFHWVETFLKEAEDMVGFPFNYRGMTIEDKNIFLKKYIKFVTITDRQITGIKFTEEVETLLGNSVMTLED